MGPSTVRCFVLTVSDTGLVELRSQTSGQSYHFEGGSNQAGNFDIGASAQNEPYGGKMTLVVQAITPQGVEVGQRQVALIRQRQ